MRRGQERARSSQRAPVYFKCPWSAGASRSRSTLSPLSPPVHSQAGRGCLHYLVQPPRQGSGSEHRAGSLQDSQLTVSGNKSESEHTIPPFFPRLSLCLCFGHPVAFCFWSVRVSVPPGRKLSLGRPGSGLSLCRPRRLHFLAEPDNLSLWKLAEGGRTQQGN